MFKKVLRAMFPKKTMAKLVDTMTAEAQKISDRQGKAAEVLREAAAQVKAAEEAAMAEKAAADAFIENFKALVQPK